MMRLLVPTLLFLLAASPASAQLQSLLQAIDDHTILYGQASGSDDFWSAFDSLATSADSILASLQKYGQSIDNYTTVASAKADAKARSGLVIVPRSSTYCDSSVTVSAGDSVSVFNFCGGLLTITTDTSLTSLGGWSKVESRIHQTDTTDQVIVGRTTALSGADLWVWSSTSARPNVRIEGEQTGSTGPKLVLALDSSSPTDGDNIGRLVFESDNNAGTAKEYAYLEVFIADTATGAEDGRIEATILKAGVETARMIIDSSGVAFGSATVPAATDLYVLNADDASRPVVLVESENGGSTGPQLVLYHDSATPVDGDELAEIVFQGEDDAGGSNEYARITGEIADASNGTENGKVVIYTVSSGLESENAVFNGGSMAVGQTDTSVAAILALTSTVKGFLPPRVTTAQRDAISGAVEGLIVFNTTTGDINFFNGTKWVFPTISAHGGLYISSSSETTISAASTPVKAAGTTTKVDTILVSMPTDGRLTYIGADSASFLITASFSMTAAGNNKLVGVQLAKNGTVMTGAEIFRQVATGTDQGAGAITFIQKLGTNDYIELFISNETDTINLTVTKLQLVMREI